MGGIGKNKQGKNKWTFVVSSLNDIQKIVEHFDIYPPITQKLGDYLLFREAVTLMQGKEHLTLEGLEKIAAIKASMNLGLSKKLKRHFLIYLQKVDFLYAHQKFQTLFE